MAWQLWLKGLVAALIGGAAVGTSLLLLDPTDFNLTAAGLAAVGKMALVGALIGAVAYLKKHPDPWKVD
jgi:hypothetical protein